MIQKRKLILIGAGGHSKSVADCIDTERFTLTGFLDGKKTGTHMGLPIFGSEIEQVPDYRNCCYFVSIGDNCARKMWFERVCALALETVNIVDKTAIIAHSARIGTGNFIGKYAIVNADSRIGDDCVINTRALVEHECGLGSHIHLSTNAVLNGNVHVGDGVFFGSCAVAIGQLTVGSDAIVGAGAVVIRDVAPGLTVVGVPARPLGGSRA